MSFQVDGQYIPGLEIQYNCEHNLPPSQQLMEWYRDRDAWDKGGTHITHMCTECTGHNTRWLYQDWTVCYDCMIPFSSNAGAKLEQEYWDYLREERQTDITEMVCSHTGNIYR